MCIWCSVVLVSVNMRSSYEQLRCLRRGLTVLICPRSGPRTLEQLQVLHIPWFFAISILSWLLIIFFFRFLRSLGACKRCVLPRRGGFVAIGAVGVHGLHGHCLLAVVLFWFRIML